MQKHHQHGKVERQARNFVPGQSPEVIRGDAYGKSKDERENKEKEEIGIFKNNTDAIKKARSPESAEGKVKKSQGF